MLGLLGDIPIALIVVAGVFAPLTGWLAIRRGRNPALWFGYGALTGPIALGILAFAPPGRCPSCDRPVAGWPAACEECGTPLGGVFGRTAQGAGPSRGTARAQGMPSARGSRPQVATASADASGRPAADQGTAPAARVAATAGTVTAMQVRARLSDRAPTAEGLAWGPPVRPTSEEVLATGIYVSGNAGMVIGALYGVARIDDRIRVFGPVDTGDLAVRLERPLAETEVAGIEDRILITSRTGRTTTSIVMLAVGGKRGEALEAAFSEGATDGLSWPGARG